MSEYKGIYLAGACKGLPDEGKTWRKNVENDFKAFNNLFGPSVWKVYNPTEYFPRNGDGSISNKQIKSFYLKRLIKNSDVVLVNLNNTENSVGTGQELQYAVDREIPIIGFGKENVYEWLFDDCDVVFDSLDEALAYIMDFFE